MAEATDHEQNSFYSENNQINNSFIQYNKQEESEIPSSLDQNVLPENIEENESLINKSSNFVLEQQQIRKIIKKTFRQSKNARMKRLQENDENSEEDQSQFAQLFGRSVIFVFFLASIFAFAYIYQKGTEYNDMQELEEQNTHIKVKATPQYVDVFSQGLEEQAVEIVKRKNHYRYDGEVSMKQIQNQVAFLQKQELDQIQQFIVEDQYQIDEQEYEQDIEFFNDVPLEYKQKYQEQIYDTLHPQEKDALLKQNTTNTTINYDLVAQIDGDFNIIHLVDPFEQIEQKEKNFTQNFADFIDKQRVENEEKEQKLAEQVKTNSYGQINQQKKELEEKRKQVAEDLEDTLDSIFGTPKQLPQFIPQIQYENGLFGDDDDSESNSDTNKPQTIENDDDLDIQNMSDEQFKQHFQQIQSETQDIVAKMPAQDSNIDQQSQNSQTEVVSKDPMNNQTSDQKEVENPQVSDNPNNINQNPIQPQTNQMKIEQQRMKVAGELEDTLDDIFGQVELPDFLQRVEMVDDDDDYSDSDSDYDYDYSDGDKYSSGSDSDYDEDDEFLELEGKTSQSPGNQSIDDLLDHQIDQELNDLEVGLTQIQSKNLQFNQKE